MFIQNIRDVEAPYIIGCQTHGLDIITMKLSDLINQQYSRDAGAMHI